MGRRVVLSAALLCLVAGLAAGCSLWTGKSSSGASAGSGNPNAVKVGVVDGALRPPFRIVWGKPAGGLIEFPAVVDHGVAYIGNQVGTIRAFSMRDGKLLWRRPTPHVELASSPAVYGELVIIHGMDGHVYVRSL